MFNEATPFYHNLAQQFLVLAGLTEAGRADLSRLDAASVERFVEGHPPGEF